MVYHYESHTTTTDYLDGTQTTSSVIVRELDEGEVGILLAGNNSIVDPSLTPRMLSVSTTDYDVENGAVSPMPYQDINDMNSTDDEDDHWFPSLRHNSWIEGLDDDDIMVDKMTENLFATAVLENDEDDERQQSKAETGDRSTTWSSKRKQNTPKRTQSSSRFEQWMDEDGADDSLVRLVPIDIIYVVVND